MLQTEIRKKILPGIFRSLYDTRTLRTSSRLRNTSINVNPMTEDICHVVAGVESTAHVTMKDAQRSIFRLIEKKATGKARLKRREIHFLG